MQEKSAISNLIGDHDLNIFFSLCIPFHPLIWLYLFCKTAVVDQGNYSFFFYSHKFYLKGYMRFPLKTKRKAFIHICFLYFSTKTIFSCRPILCCRCIVMVQVFPSKAQINILSHSWILQLLIILLWIYHDVKMLLFFLDLHYSNSKLKKTSWDLCFRPSIKNRFRGL